MRYAFFSFRFFFPPQRWEKILNLGNISLSIHVRHFGYAKRLCSLSNPMRRTARNPSCALCSPATRQTDYIGWARFGRSLLIALALSFFVFTLPFSFFFVSRIQRTLDTRVRERCGEATFPPADFVRHYQYVNYYRPVIPSLARSLSLTLGFKLALLYCLPFFFLYLMGNCVIKSVVPPACT